MDVARESPAPDHRHLPVLRPHVNPQRAVNPESLAFNLSWDGPVERESWNGGDALSYVGRPASVLHILDRARLLWPDQPAVIDPSLHTTTTYQDFADMAAGLATRLRSCGVVDGDRVAVLADNAAWVAAAMFACALLKAIFVGLNPRAPIPLLVDQLRAARPVLVLSDPDAESTATTAAQHATAGLSARLPTLVVDARRVGQASWRTPPDPPDATTYMVITTSGSAGIPKGVRISHRGSVHAGLLYAKRVPLTPQDRVACPLPLFYVGGMHSALLPAMLHGAPVVMGSGHNPRRDLDGFLASGVTFAVATSGWWQAALRDPRCTDEHLTLRSVGVGGAPWDHLRPVFSRQLPRAQVFGVYGMTETHGPGIHADADELARRPGGVGRCAGCLEAEVRSEEGQPMARGSEGTLWLRGSLITSGYAWGESFEANAALGGPELSGPELSGPELSGPELSGPELSGPELSGPVLDGQGWLRTGDMARIAPDGWITLLGRREDLINRGGRKISVAEVERCLRAHPEVEDCAVLGYSRHNGRDAVGACVVWARDPETPAHAPTEQSHDGVRSWVATQLGAHAAPRIIVTLTALPRTAAGKTDRAALRRLLPLNPALVHPGASAPTKLLSQE